MTTPLSHVEAYEPARPHYSPLSQRESVPDYRSPLGESSSSLMYSIRQPSFTPKSVEKVKETVFSPQRTVAPRHKEAIKYTSFTSTGVHPRKVNVHVVKDHKPNEDPKTSGIPYTKMTELSPLKVSVTLEKTDK